MHEIEKTHALTLKDGIKDGIPIFLGYFPIAITFGILAKTTEISLMETLAFSFIVFAGASQFIGVSMIAAGSGPWEIIIATLFLNFRHFLMSASLAKRVEISRFWLRPVIGFFVTDETFSVASFSEGKLSDRYMLPMQILGYIGWGIGTGCGYLVGNILPQLLQKSMGIGLYAMFMALLTPEMKKTKRALILALYAGMLNTGLTMIAKLEKGWSIVISIVVVSLLAVWFEEIKAEKKGGINLE